MKATSLSLTLALSLAAVTAARAQTVIMDQIGNTPSFFTGKNAYASQIFESANASFNIGALDNFTATTFLDITNVSVALLGFTGFTPGDYANITGYEVNIYSSVAAAGTSLTGNVAHTVVSPASATRTSPFGGDANSALVSIPVNLLLPSAGTYYVSVIPDLAFGTVGDQIGVYGTTGLAGSNPGGTNGVQANPNGGFGFGPTQTISPASDLAYRITAVAVPEPSTYALFGAGVVLLGVVAARRQDQARTAA